MRELNEKNVRDFLKETRKSKDIEQEFGISGRMWRHFVNGYNADYENKERLIVSSNQGYTITTNKKTIKKYAFNLIKNALAQLRNGKKILGVLANKNQLKLEDGESDLVDMVMVIND